MGTAVTVGDEHRERRYIISEPVQWQLFASNIYRLIVTIVSRFIVSYVPQRTEQNKK